jgi:hypothetical protein
MSAAGSFATVGAGWRNPVPEVRPFDDEIAVASVLELMCRYVEDDAGFYELAEAAQDQYLYMCLQEAAKRRASVRSSRQPWDDQLGERGAGVPPPKPGVEDDGQLRAPVRAQVPVRSTAGTSNQEAR